MVEIEYRNIDGDMGRVNDPKAGDAQCVNDPDGGCTAGQVNDPEGGDAHRDSARRT